MRYTRLPIALLFAVSAPTLALAEPVTLNCQANDGSNAWIYRVDYATGEIQELGANGPTRSAKAKVTETAITWSFDRSFFYVEQNRQTSEHWGGEISRLSGEGSVVWYYGDANPPATRIKCRTAAQKF